MGKVQFAVSFLLTVLLTIAAISCGGKAQPQPQAPDKVAVVILLDPGLQQAGFNYEGEFRPVSVTVAVGGTVSWNNTDNKDHTVVSYDGIFNHRLQSGQSFNFTFTQNGTYKYHDILYDGMDGFVYVK